MLYLLRGCLVRNHRFVTDENGELFKHYFNSENDSTVWDDADKLELPEGWSSVSLSEIYEDGSERNIPPSFASIQNIVDGITKPRS